MLLQPLTVHEVMLLAARSHEDYRTCIVCGGTPTEQGIVVSNPPSELDTAAWCDTADCQADRAKATAITVPIAQPLPQHEANDAAADERARIVWWLRAGLDGPASMSCTPEYLNALSDLADVIEQHPERFADAPTGRDRG